MLVYPGIAKSFSLKATLFDEPTRWNLIFLRCHFIKGGSWIGTYKFIEFFLGYYRVLKKTSTVAQFFWIGQFTLSYSDNGIGNILDAGINNAPVPQLGSDRPII